jgi:hypothetical protein
MQISALRGIMELTRYADIVDRGVFSGNQSASAIAAWMHICSEGDFNISMTGVDYRRG